MVNNPSSISDNFTFDYDVTRPIINSVSINSNPTTDRLKVSDFLQFELPDGSFSSDIQSVTGAFNSTSLNFVLTGRLHQNLGRQTLRDSRRSRGSNRCPELPELVIVASDIAGNSLSSSFTSDVIYLFDANTPFISSLSHNGTVAGTLYTHHAYATDDTSIEFTFNLTTPDLGISIEAYYNETSGGPIPLNFSPNSDGSQYVGTYYVRANHNSKSTPINLTTLVVSDAFGNFTTDFTNDINKTIDTEAPSLVSIVSTTNLIANTVPNSSTYLKIGDQLQFVASFSSTASISSVTAEFNSQLLSFSSNTPTTWIATYTVIEGHPSPTTSSP